ncbi:aminopeptidase [Paenibacillus sp. N1-5-1-14]|uniref:aminopeptidase n=1 Tax=Paenibacillus radicibacter TaxID=2972488 RepID=UPI002159568E|nr:aminopeptidase [Paenibacillus radicibacter]MCR8642744.1 aminopeptidase [Paenibacillus radicibacter]
MSLFQQNLEKYANLAIRTGINLQEGQTLVVNASIECAPLVRLVVKKAYEAGAKNVMVEWSDDTVTRTKYELAPDEAFTEFPMWRAQGFEELAASNAAFLSIYAPNPDLLTGIDPKRIATNTKTASTAMSKYRAYLMSDRAVWSLVGHPTVEWARKVFPNAESNDDAVAKLWDVIFETTRIPAEDPVAAWQEHCDQLHKVATILNEKQYKTLAYEAPGTNFTLDLVENHIWAGGGAVSESGTPFRPNMPTEEVFTMPHKDGMNGTVRSTKPLNYGGTVIDNFSITFENGKVVDYSAEQGYETLKHLVETDEGSSRLGEVALVPHKSPISDTNLIFFNTLFDENASCHLAIGNAYPTNVQGGTKMTDEEKAASGVNQSLTHVDFMIGSAELNVDGITKDGKREPIMRNGNWAIL